MQRSEDGGKTWETLPPPGEPSSYIISIATHPSDPDLVLASSLYGQLFYGEDDGGSWQKVRKEFSETGPWRGCLPEPKVPRSCWDTG